MALASIFRAAGSGRVLPVLADWWCRLRHAGVMGVAPVGRASQGRWVFRLVGARVIRVLGEHLADAGAIAARTNRNEVRTNGPSAPANRPTHNPECQGSTDIEMSTINRL